MLLAGNYFLMLQAFLKKELRLNNKLLILILEEGKKHQNFSDQLSHCFVQLLSSRRNQLGQFDVCWSVVAALQRVILVNEYFVWQTCSRQMSTPDAGPSCPWQLQTVKMQDANCWEERCNYKSNCCHNSNIYLCSTLCQYSWASCTHTHWYISSTPAYTKFSSF